MAIIVPILSTWNPVGIEAAVMDISRAQTKLDKAASFGKSATAAGKKLTMGLTVPLALLGAAAVNAAADFDESMAIIKNMSPPDTNFKDIESTIREFGRNSVYSSQEVADAFIVLQKAGVSTGDIMREQLGASLDLAATEGMNMADAAEIMANTMSTFEEQGVSATKVVDMLAAGAMASTASVEDMAFSLKYASGSAATLGVPIDELVTSIALLSNAGLKGSTAGTSLNNVLMAMASPTAKAEERMKELGISYKNAKGEMKSLPKIFTDIGKSMDDAGMSRADKLAALKDMFNIRGARAAAVLAVMDNATGKFKEMAKEVDKNGVAYDMQQARVNSFRGSLEKTTGAIKDALISLGLALQPVIEFVGRIVAAFATWFSELSPGVRTAVAGFLLFAAAIGPILLVVGMLAGALSAIVALITGPVGMAIAVTIGAFGWWIVAILAVAAAVIAVGVIIYKNWGKIKDFFIRTWKAIVDYFKKGLDTFKKSFPETFNFIVTAVKVFINAMKVWFTAWWGWMKATFMLGFNTIKTLIVAWFNVMKALLTTAFNIWWGLFKNLLSVIFTIVEAGLRIVKALFKGDFDQVGKIIKEAGSKIYSIVRGIPGRILSALGNLGNLLYDAGRDLISGLISGITDMLNSLKGTAGKILDIINPLSSSTSSGASGVASSAGLSTFGLTPSSTTTSSSRVVINISGDRDPYTTARLVKRAVEGYDISQGRPRGTPLAVSW